MVGGRTEERERESLKEERSRRIFLCGFNFGCSSGTEHIKCACLCANTHEPWRQKGREPRGVGTQARLRQAATAVPLIPAFFQPPNQGICDCSAAISPKLMAKLLSWLCLQIPFVSPSRKPWERGSVGGDLEGPCCYSLLPLEGTTKHGTAPLAPDLAVLSEMSASSVCC